MLPLRRTAGWRCSSLTLLVASFAIYASLSIAPGDPLSVLTGGRTLPPEAMTVLRARYHLNEPLPPQYWHWLRAAVHGDLGELDRAARERQHADQPAHRGHARALVLRVGADPAVGDRLGRRSPGCAAARSTPTVITGRPCSPAMPSFVAAIVLISVFAVKLGWFPALGAGTGVLDRFWHLTLPAIALALSALALVARVTTGQRARGDGARARADRDQPRPALAPRRAPPRAAQRGHPDHDGQPGSRSRR